MTRRDQLQDEYEDALFALLMEDFAQEEEAELEEEEARLREDPEAAVSSALNARCRRTIRRTFAWENWKKLGKTAERIARRAAVFVVIVAVLFGTAFAAFPQVREMTLNLLVEASNMTAELTLGGTMRNENGPKNLLGYCLPEPPDGFEVKSEDNTALSAFVEYRDGDGRIIQVFVCPAEGTAVSIDTENAQYVKPIKMHGFDGLLIEKDGRVEITWADTDQLRYIEVCCEGIDKEFAVKYAEEIIFEGDTK